MELWVQSYGILPYFCRKNMKKIHFIAIGGSIMHQLAICLQQAGWEVTGSDDEIFEPARSNLAQQGLLPATLGWFPNKIDAQLDAVIVGMHAKADNPELLAAQQQGIPIHGYPQYIYEHARYKRRIMVGGSHGKTTTTAMIMHVLRQLGRDFDYLVGARLADFDSSVRLTNDAPLMVIEGDEYLASPLTPFPKFHFYQPHIAILTGIAWDHVNVFPTFEEYVEQFRIFIRTLPPQAILVYCQHDKHLVRLLQDELWAEQLQLIPYGTPDYESTETGSNICYEGESFDLLIFGKHNLQNMAAAQVVCEKIGINPHDFLKAMTTFAGAARRLEKVTQNKHSVCFKDFAHAPSKVKATTEALKTQYPHRRLIACFELHTYSSLNKDFLHQYQHALAAADVAIVFFEEHTFAIKKLPLLTIADVQKGFQRADLLVFNNTKDLQTFLDQQDYHNTNLLLMSSGNFGGLDMIDLQKHWQ